MNDITGTKKRILETAKSMVEKEGLKGLTIQRIIDRCGIGKTTFYKLFPTKKELLLQLKYFGQPNPGRIYSLKDQIAEFALKSFKQYGYNGIDMEYIAKAANLNRVTLYRYFPNKDVLIAYCLQGEFNKVKDMLSEHVMKYENAEEALMHYFEFLGIFLRESKGNAFIAQSWALVMTNPAVQMLTADLGRHFLEAFMRILENGKEKGLFRKDIDNSIFAGIIIMLQNGFMFTMTFEPGFISPEAIMKTTFNMILKEIKVRKA